MLKHKTPDWLLCFHRGENSERQRAEGRYNRGVALRRYGTVRKGFLRLKTTETGHLEADNQAFCIDGMRDWGCVDIGIGNAVVYY